MEEYITKIKGPCVILAGAGTGKTYSIIEKIKYIIKNRLYKTDKIVCLTFSNEAANALREKILPVLEEEKEPIIKTFHSFCFELLKKHGKLINVDDNFKILLPDDTKIMLHKNLGINPNYCAKYISEIGMAKDLGIKIDNLEKYLSEKNTENISELSEKLENKKFELHTLHIKNKSEIKEQLKKEIAEIEKNLKIAKFLQAWKSYEKLKNKKNFQDYSDLNKNALFLLENHPEIAENFDYIIVDEFQDTNKLQCELLEKIAPHKNITIVGDLNQSIYRFRGAYKDNIENFRKTFNVQYSDIFALDKSYRSTNKILEVAHQLIENNYKNKSDCFKVLSAINKEGEEINIFELKNGNEEARKIIEIIKQEIEKNTQLNEICVMFRTHQQANLIKKFLEQEKIPFVSITKKPLLKIGIIKKIRSYLTILDNLSNKKRGGEQAWFDLVYNSDFLNEDVISIGVFLKEDKEPENISDKIINEHENIKLSEKGRMQLKSIIKNIKNILPYSNKPITELIEKLYHEIGMENIDANKELAHVLEKFKALTKEYSEADSNLLSDFLHHLNIIDILKISIDAPSLENNGIRIMTNHATKGLEYEVVILSNLAQKKFPVEIINNSIIPYELSPEISHLTNSLSEDEKEIFIKNHESGNQLLEERRLCYVGFTRAKSRLYLTYAQEYSSRKYYPSQFLLEINYKNNPNIKFTKDEDEKYKEPIESQHPTEIIKNQEKKLSFSPSALQTFDECQKKYEYKHIFNMPETIPAPWDVMRLGQFIHKVLEDGVKNQYKSAKEFVDLAKIIQMEEQWNFVNLDDALPLIKIFFERNKNKYNKNSMTETWLETKISGINFAGRADRIDFHPDGIEIIDYKTGKTFPNPKYRNWQLGFYALATQQLKLGKPKHLTLETLQKETPIEFILDEYGNAKELHSKQTYFNLNQVKNELVETANKIIKAMHEGFKPCAIDSNCEFCNEWVYN